MKLANPVDVCNIAHPQDLSADEHPKKNWQYANLYSTSLLDMEMTT